jgi:hypothetical protein
MLLPESHHSHESVFFPLMGKSAAVKQAEAASMRGPFVYFVPKAAICGPAHAGPRGFDPTPFAPRAPGRFIGEPSRLSFTEDAVLAISLLDKRSLVSNFL